MSAWFLDALGLTIDSSERDIRRVYAQRLKHLDPVTEPAGFAELRQAYEAALAWRRGGQQPAFVAPVAGTDAPPVASAEAEARDIWQGFRRSLDNAVNDDDAERCFDDALTRLHRGHIEAAAAFEHFLVEALASGSAPRAAWLFTQAADHFRWREVSRLAALRGYANWVDATLGELDRWAGETAETRWRVLDQVDRFRATPNSEQVLHGWPAMRWVAAAYPRWLSLLLTRAAVENWRQRYENLAFEARRAAAMHTKRPGARVSEKVREMRRQAWSRAWLRTGGVFAVLIGLLLVAAFGAILSPNAAPKTRPGVPDYLVDARVDPRLCVATYKYLHQSGWTVFHDPKGVAALREHARNCIAQGDWPRSATAPDEQLRRLGLQ